MRLVSAAAPGAFTIRPFENGDRNAVRALWRAVFPDLHSDPDADMDFCLQSGHGALFVGEVDSLVVATAMAGHDGHRGWLHRVATGPDHRGRGYATQLIAHAETYLGGLGVPKINLQILASNADVAAFYEKLGYARETRLSMAKRVLAPPPLALADAGAAVPPGRLRVIITYLQMAAPPRAVSPPRPALKLAVLRAEKVSVPFYRYLYNTVGQLWLWHERRRLSDERLAEIVQHDDVDVHVLYVGGEPAGYAELDRRVAGEIELAYFGLVPWFIGRGLGPWFLHWTIAAAWERTPRRLWVHTCNLDHPKAFAMYQRAGFAPYRQASKLVLDPRPLA